MRNLVYLLLLVQSLTFNQKEINVIPTYYIEIEYIGQHSYKSLLIYTGKSKLEIIKEELTKRFDSFKQIMPAERYLTKEEKIEKVNSSFDFVLTDENTYQKIINFIRTRDHLFTSGIGYEGYEIKESGKTRYVPYKFKDEFFKEFKKYLKIRNCEKDVIERVDAFSEGT